MQEDEQGGGQEAGSYGQGEEEAGEGREEDHQADITNNMLEQVNDAFEILRQHTSNSTNHRIPKVKSLSWVRLDI